MSNHLYNQLNTSDNSSSLNFNDFQQNPQGMIQQMSHNNPKVADMLHEYANSGMSAKDFFFKKVNEMGINPQSILNQIK